MRRTLPVLAAVALAATLAAAAPAKRPAGKLAAPGSFTLEHLLTLRSVGDPTWSPDGRRVAFVVTASDTAENLNNPDLWIAEPATGQCWQLTRHPKPDTSPTFSPSGDTLAFIGTRASGDEARPAIYMLSLRGGEPWPFGGYDEAVSEVEWSPDGRYLAFTMTDTLPKQIREWRKKKWDPVIEDQRLQYTHLWLIEVATAGKTRLTSGEFMVSSIHWSPDSKQIAFVTNPTGKPDDGSLSDFGIVSVGGGPLRRLGVLADGGYAWSPDGKWIAWAGGESRALEVQKSDLWVIPAAGGRPRNLTARFDEDAGSPRWSARGDTLFFHSAQGVTTRIAMVPFVGGPVTLGVDRAAEASTPATAANGRVAWVQSAPTAPPELWIADHFGAPGRPLTALNAPVAKLALGTTRAVRWLSDDGVTVEGLLLRPHGAPERAALKTLVLLHGGPYAARYGLSFQGSSQYFAAHGYQVFMPNFRSSGGYGTAFMLRQRSDWGGQDWRDVMSGVDSLVSRGLADGRRLGVYGGSYGGYLSAWAITQTDRFKAACVFAGAVDLPSLYGQSDTQKYRAFEFEGFPWETPEKWARSSPYTYIKNAKTPTLIIIGENDPRIPYPQGQQLYRALLGLKVPTEFAHYPREGHGLREPRHRADQHLRLLAWFDRWIR